MRITPNKQQEIKNKAEQLLGDAVAVWVFGSRVNNNATGGDLDLLVVSDTPITNPVETSAKLAVQIKRLFWGRKVDVILSAPNLEKQPIHQIAMDTGQRL